MAVLPEDFLKLLLAILIGRLIGAGRTKSGEDTVCGWEAYGRPEQHERLVEKLLAHADVKEFQM